MMLSSRNTKGLNRKGIVMFVVLGAILVLGVLVFSYNFFVRGKFNESREILMHLRASKCAQAVSSYVFAHLISDLQASADDTRAGDILREKVFISNDEAGLSSLIKKEWFENIDCSGLVHSLLDGTVGKKEIDWDVEFNFKNIIPLSSKHKQLYQDENVYFFPSEKVGRLTVKVTIMIDHTREIWQETRPFKVVMPFPIPLTKFSFYWKDGVEVTDPYCFNNVIVSSENGKPVSGSKYPFIFDNGSGIPNDDEHVTECWKNRGWIYVGGSDLCLNRACGDLKYGQRYYSYPRGTAAPSTLMLDFHGGDKLDNITEKESDRLGFRVAHWGFSDAVVANGDDNMWKKILKGEFEENPYDTNKTYWQSSSLHLFSELNVLDSNTSNFVPSITRVTGKVQDRFMEMGYLLPINSSTSIFGAVINYYDKESFEEARSNDESSKVRIFENNSIDEFLFFPKGFDYEKDMVLARNLRSYFCNRDFKYNDYTNPNEVSYRNVMSKILMHGIDEIYDVIAAYSVNSNNINLPPTKLVPRTTEMSFNPPDNNIDMDPDFSELIKDLKIDKIGAVKDTTLGLNLRACYVIKEISQLSKLGSNSNGYGLNLNNLVYKIESEDETANLGSSLSINSPGAIFSEGPIRLGSFAPNAEPDKVPLLVLAGNGAISVDNSGENEVRAYLVALGEDGTVKANNAGAPLYIRGGMAVKTFSPENLPNAGGHLAYNRHLDPTGKDSGFIRHLGVAFGPKGGKL